MNKRVDIVKTQLTEFDESLDQLSLNMIVQHNLKLRYAMVTSNVLELIEELDYAERHYKLYKDLNKRAKKVLEDKMKHIKALEAALANYNDNVLMCNLCRHNVNGSEESGDLCLTCSCYDSQQRHSFWGFDLVRYSKLIRDGD